MKTFAQTKGKRVINWNSRLNRLINFQSKGSVSKEYKHLQTISIRDSEDWVTCACGNQCSIIPRLPEDNWYADAPKDEILRNLGMKFFNDIDYEQYQTAKNTLMLIEQRSAELIKALKKKKSKK